MTTHPQRAAWQPCDVCGEAIDAPGDGVLSINRDRLSPRAHETDYVEREHVGPSGQRLRVLTVLDTAAEPAWAIWLWTHAACAPDDGNVRITADRIETSAKALELTLQLLEHDWLARTNWADTLRRFILTERRVNRS